MLDVWWVSRNHHDGEGLLMDVLPWDAIVKGVLGLVVLCFGFFGIRAIGSSSEKRKQAEKGVKDAEKVAEVMAEPVPTRRKRIRDLLRSR